MYFNYTNKFLGYSKSAKTYSISLLGSAGMGNDRISSLCHHV